MAKKIVPRAKRPAPGTQSPQRNPIARKLSRGVFTEIERFFGRFSSELTNVAALVVRTEEVVLLSGIIIVVGGGLVSKPPLRT